LEILILGGTSFLGPALVNAALARGHRVTLFHRGISNPKMFPDLRHVYGDRRRDLQLLQDGSWDCVIDTCGWVPDVVDASASFLQHRANLYVFVSTGSVYADLSHIGLDENSPTSQVCYQPGQAPSEDAMGGLKALCERAVAARFSGRALIIRPGTLVGRDDPLHRLAYWTHRVQQGGEVLAPGKPDRHIQLIDVRDLAEWVIGMLEMRRVGTYNTVSRPADLTMGDLIETCRRVCNLDASISWVSDQILCSQDIRLNALPFWIPASMSQYAGLYAMDSRKAIESGLHFRDLAETIRSTANLRPGEVVVPPPSGLLSPSAEADLLAIHRQTIGVS
jgi:2'-hydroxyisoflavone reductase